MNMNKRVDKKLRVLLINPFFIFSEEQYVYDLNAVLNKNYYVDIPLGLAYISSYLQNNHPGIEVEVYDANAMAVKEIYATKKVKMEHLWAMVHREIDLFNPDIVGISGMFEFIAPMANKFVYLVKEVNHYITTVMGGGVCHFFLQTIV